MDTPEPGPHPSLLPVVAAGFILLIVMIAVMVFLSPHDQARQPPVTPAPGTKAPEPSTLATKTPVLTKTKAVATMTVDRTTAAATKMPTTVPTSGSASSSSGGGSGAPVRTSSQVTLRATQTALQAPPEPAVPKDFTFSISPESATAPAGGRVVYTARVDPVGGFSDPITLKIRVKAPFYDKTYDLGTLTAPYPKSIEYPFDVPGYVPGGIQITGVIQADGGGKHVEKTVYLTVQ